MPLKLTKMRIENFKSFKELDYEFNDFSVIIGKNASGKTNFIEFFKFFRNVVMGDRSPYVPYMDWWSYKNIVWNGTETLPIKVKLDFKLREHEILYSLNFTGIGGYARILSESLNIDNIITLNKEGYILTIKYDEKTFSKHEGAIKKMINNMKLDYFYEDSIYQQTIKTISDQISLLDLSPITSIVTSSTDETGEKINLCIISSNMLDSSLFVYCPTTEVENGGDVPPLFIEAIIELKNYIERIIILRHPNISILKSPSIPRRSDKLTEDSSNLNNVLYNIWMKNGSKFPDSLIIFLENIFPGLIIKPKLSDDGKVYMTITENKIELDPPSISDGLFKGLSILTSIELNPSIICVDEVENCLYAEALEYIFDELRDADAIVILTTHSPLIIDMVKLEEIRLFEKSQIGTILKKIDDPELMRTELIKQGLKQSESWIEGKLI